MALIEGVGDEVTLLFAVVFLVLVLVLAWASTHTADRSEQLFTSSPASPATAPHRAGPQSTLGATAPSETDPQETAPAAGGRGEEGKDSSSSVGEEESTEGAAHEGGEFGGDGLRHRETAGGVQSVPDPRPPDSPEPSASSANSQPPQDDSPDERNMVLRLKFLNDTERVAQVKPEDTIGYIKRTYFAGQEHQVRLIYQGQLLRDDAQTLASLNLPDHCVLHCHISQHATPQVPAGARAADQVHVALNVGSLMVPLFVLMLSVLWYFQIQYRQFFTAPATASLVGITIFFSFVAFGVYRR
ncbi:transmembrane and ubiquitin-like domain-containing protein 1 [Amia ocellicauda]|uniref:transmembrane and ubiquitin-like domain-containing protein 1 n=1 Tax=Amia ocellicauda TaxID=2972642 RepID=UPI0034639EE9